jgi:calcium/proton exchanger
MVVEILGSCFFVAGYGKETALFNMDMTSIMSSLMIVSSGALIIPSALGPDSPQSEPSDETPDVLVLSYITSIILLFFYVVYLYFKLKSHAHLFHACIVVEEDNSYRLDPWAASTVLIVATIGVAVCSDYVVDSVDGIVEASGVSRAFIGLIVVPIVGNAGEYVTTVTASMKNQLDLAIGVVAESTLQIALFVTPFLVVLGWIIGQQMALDFDRFEITVFFLAVIVVNCLIRDGRTNYFEGALLVGT